MAYPVSDKFKSALQSGEIKFVVQVTVTANGQAVPGYTNLPIESATITCSRTQAQRTTLSVRFDPLAGQSIVPTDMSSPLAPNGNELVISAGLKYRDNTTELIPCGVFPIQTVVVTDTGTDLQVQATCTDRSWSISRRVLLQPYSIAAGYTLDQALHSLLSANTSGMPPFSYAIQTTGALAPANTYNEGQDPWQAALDLASGAGFECFFDRFGNLQSRPIPTPGTISPTWAAAEASNAAPLAITRTLTANQVSNDFVVFSSSSHVSPPVRAEASDGNPASATYTGGKFGDIVTFLSSSSIADVTGAQAAAQAQLNLSLGQMDNLQLSVLPNPAVDIDDIYTVTRSRAGLNNSQWVVDGYSLPLGVGALMTLNLRRVTL
jgi:hypothetical protein